METTIQVDTREKQKAIKSVLSYFDKNKIKHCSSKLYVGDYMSWDNPRLIVDRKQNLQELCTNVCQQHKRFIAEIKKADEYGVKLIFLCEHGRGIKTLDDVASWDNPRIKDSPLAVSGERLHRILSTLQYKYNIEFIFCDKQQTGRMIAEILSGHDTGHGDRRSGNGDNSAGVCKDTQEPD